MRTARLFAALLVVCSASLAKGTLAVHPDNPRYFTDGSGRAIYLGGHQMFVDLQDNSFNKEFIRNNERILHWDSYVQFLKAQNFNYLRNWVIWSTGSGSMAPVNNASASPMPYKRVAGHGKAKDGKGKFDLDQFDEAFFGRMRTRCEDLQDAGVYVASMLFEVYGFLGGEASGESKQTLWDGNVFNGANNINGIDTDYDGNGKGIEFFYTDDERIIQLQRDYVRKVIDTVNHLDNVFYEIANELYAPQWQYDLAQFIKSYEKTRPKQHVVLMSAGGRTRTGSWKQMDAEAVISSPADCFAVAGSWKGGCYRRKDPTPNGYGKPGIVDMDHVSPGSSDVGFVWTAFTRGYNFNLYDKPFENPGAEGPEWERVRRNVSKAVEYAGRLDLANAAPSGELASTGFCLAKPGFQYVIYQPEAGPIMVSGLNIGQRYSFELYDTGSSEVVGGGRFRADRAQESFGEAVKGSVLYLARIAGDGAISGR